MVLYHGTTETNAKNICQNGIDLNVSSKAVDFGKGFYTTPSFESAKRWAIRRSIANGEKASVVEVYVDEKEIESVLEKFKDDIRWARFIINNRNGLSYINKISYKEHNLDARYDITYGRIADKDVYNSARFLKKSDQMIENYEEIFNHNYDFQYAFHTEKAIDFIKKLTYLNV